MVIESFQQFHKILYIRKLINVILLSGLHLRQSSYIIMYVIFQICLSIIKADIRELFASCRNWKTR